eukprot:405490-Rhodomonas_salina.3
MLYPATCSQRSAGAKASHLSLRQNNRQDRGWMKRRGRIREWGYGEKKREEKNRGCRARGSRETGGQAKRGQLREQRGGHG